MTSCWKTAKRTALVDATLAPVSEGGTGAIGRELPGSDCVAVGLFSPMISPALAQIRARSAALPRTNTVAFSSARRVRIVS